MDVEKLKQEQHEKTKEVLERFDMDFSIYSDTDCDHNRKQTYDMFEELYCSGYIKQKEQNLPYCLNDRRFLPDRYIEGECPHCGGLARGDQCDDCGKLVEPQELDNKECQICGNSNIEFRDTKHLFLDLEPFKDDLNEWMKSDPVPENMRSQVENDIEEAEDRSITRDQNWGFDVPVERVNKRIEDEGLDVPKLGEEFEEKVLYVWFDAPIGYIGFTRELFDDNEEWKDYWMNDRSDVYYSIGKDNAIFHSVIWPSMLKGASTEEEEYTLPTYEFIHQYLLAEDTKFSKSRGKGLSTEEALEMYPSDYWRFYLARNLPNHHDTRFEWKDFENEINNVLNDTVGNFVNRTLSLAEQWFDNQVPDANLTDADEEVVEEAEEIVEKYQEKFEEHDLKEALDEALKLARLGDQYLSDEEPWNNEERREETIYVSVQLCRAIGATLYPYTPEASEKIGDMLDIEIDTSERVDELSDPLLGGVDSGHELGEREILFEKIDVDEDRDTEQEKEVNDELKRLNSETVGFEEFGVNEIRIGKVLEVDEHPNADKLYKIKIDVGGAELQTCAGLKNHYSKEELEDRKVVVLANLEPAELRGEKSECMILVAEDEEGNVSLLETGEEMKVGSEIK